MMKRLLAAAFGLALSCGAAGAQTVAQTTRTPVVIAAGNTFQTVLTAVTSTNQRRSLTIQNNNATDSCWLDYGIGITAGNATKAGGILLLPGGSYTRYYPYVPSDEIEATCTTTSDTMRVDVQ
jgi:hypothetical protein